MWFGSPINLLLRHWTFKLPTCQASTHSSSLLHSDQHRSSGPSPALSPSSRDIFTGQHHHIHLVLPVPGSLGLGLSPFPFPCVTHHTRAALYMRAPGRGGMSHRVEGRARGPQYVARSRFLRFWLFQRHSISSHCVFVGRGFEPISQPRLLQSRHPLCATNIVPKPLKIHLLPFKHLFRLPPNTLPPLLGETSQLRTLILYQLDPLEE